MDVMTWRAVEVARVLDWWVFGLFDELTHFAVDLRVRNVDSDDRCLALMDGLDRLELRLDLVRDCLFLMLLQREVLDWDDDDWRLFLQRVLDLQPVVATDEARYLDLDLRFGFELDLDRRRPVAADVTCLRVLDLQDDVTRQRLHDVTVDRDVDCDVDCDVDRDVWWRFLDVANDDDEADFDFELFALPLDFVPDSNTRIK